METITKKKTKTFLILISTLIIGMLIGGALVGRVVKVRIDKLQSFTTADGFVNQYAEIIGEMPADQKEVVMPILERSGNEMETLMKNTRTQFSQINDKLESELKNHLNDEQLKAITIRKNTIRERLNNRRN
ncbi:hypothetical protein [Pseudemcibacter aquimaris]|uniref:hypothetical protein n=1 Tax=Pseudemcibacter aquimaris TaxID=2857064 RepID=UPI002012E80D|nr:hypothetical protein [Pseudemcibacter aquimaris]MCC3861192.1 hypothetical protein [Pseudemcibacter aquimaris]WDU57967.1 hypothetical protein KW060_12275 [Pseudemcibacter aquimaris]